MLPALARGYMGEVGANWCIAELRPGDQPFARLAEALLQDKAFWKAWVSPIRDGGKAKTYGGAASRSTPTPLPGGGNFREEGQSNHIAFLTAALRRGARSLHEVLNQAGLPDGTRLLILVDQFEELFRYRDQAEDQAAAFAALLLEACRHPDIYIVITMRSDFLGQAAGFQGLPEAINAGLYLTPRLSREQLANAIGKPARLFGGKVTSEGYCFPPRTALAHLRR